MRRILTLFILCVSFWQSVANAQIIGDESLQKLQNGEVSFLEGEFIAFLDDTVSPDFVRSAFLELGYELGFEDIHSIQILIINTPADSTIERLRMHPLVSDFIQQTEKVDTLAIERALKDQGVEGSFYNQALENILNSPPTISITCEFEYSVNEAKLKEIMSTFRNVAYEIIRNIPRSVNIKAEPGSEADVMEKVEELPFVQSTALIGVIKD
ncbi:MAG: hypothetical protein RLN81_14605 [Balneolaceae bacterium]